MNHVWAISISALYCACSTSKFWPCASKLPPAAVARELAVGRQHRTPASPGWFVNPCTSVRASVVATGLHEQACCIPTYIPCSLPYNRDLNAAFSACVVCQSLPRTASGCPSYVNVPYLTSLLPCTPAAQHEWTRYPAYYMPTRTTPHG